MAVHRSRQQRLIVAVGLATLVLSACAHRSPRAEIESAYGAGTTPSTQPTVAGGSTPPPDSRPAGPPVQSSGSSGPAVSPSGPVPVGGSDAPVAPGVVAPEPSGGDASPGAAPNATPAPETEPPAPGPETANKSTVNIGHVGTYTGIIGAVLSGGQPMAQAWAQDVNSRGGLNGHPVNLITADDGGDPARAQSLMQDMVENQGVIAFVGNMTPLTTQAYQEYVQRVRVPVVGGMGYQHAWWEVPMLFPNSSYFDTIIIGGLKEVVQRGRVKVASLHCVEAFACQQMGRMMGEGAAEQAGAELVYDTEISLAQPNFTRECLAARDAGAEAMLIGADVNAVSRVARDCRSQGYAPLMSTATLAATESARSDPNLDGIIFISGVFPWPATDTPAASRHAEVLATYAPNTPASGATSQVWSAARLLEAATVALPDSPTSEDVIDGLYALPANFDNEGLSPSLNFHRDGVADKSQCYSAVILDGGEFTAPQGTTYTCV